MSEADSFVRRTTASDGVAVLTITRTDRKNALNAACYQALAAALSDADSDPTVRAIVLTGAGGQFTAGNDLADFRDLPAQTKSLPGIRMLSQIADSQTPLIAAVEGLAIGIGTTLLLHCDLAYAGKSTRFRAPFVSLGLSPEGGSSLLLPALAGLKKASEILLLGDFFSAQDAQAIGLINAVTNDGDALSMAVEKATRLAALPPEALHTTRALLRAPLMHSLQRTIDIEEEEFLRLCKAEEAQTAIGAFFKKR